MPQNRALKSCCYGKFYVICIIIMIFLKRKLLKAIYNISNLGIGRDILKESFIYYLCTSKYNFVMIEF